MVSNVVLLGPVNGNAAAESDRGVYTSAMWYSTSWRTAGDVAAAATRSATDVRLCA
jgi:hypothetical protein